MYYQQQPSVHSPTKVEWTSDWSNPAHIAANQQGYITPQQRAMLGQLPSPWIAGMLLGGLSFLLFVPSLALATSLQDNLFLLLFVIPLILLVVSFVSRRSRRSRLLQATESGAIQQVQGEVIWDEKHRNYTLHTPTERLTTVVDSLALPPPGPYHFYYLTGWNILLSAQPIRTYTQAIAYPDMLAASGLPGNEQARLALQQALYHALNFGPSDLECNRAGKLSSKQRRTSSRKLVGQIIGAIVGALIGLGVIIGLSNYAVQHGGGAIFFEVSCFYLFGLLVFLGSFLYLLLGVKKERAEIRRMAISWIDGPVQAEKRESEDGCSCYFRIDKLSFSVPCSGCDALVRGLRYRVYYLPAMNLLVSLEPLETPLR